MRGEMRKKSLAAMASIAIFYNPSGKAPPDETDFPCV
jgi:hypothetical protein